MKKRFCLLTAIILFGGYILTGKAALTGKNTEEEGTINVFTTPGLYDLTIKWANEFTCANPQIKINVTRNLNSSGPLNIRKGIGITDDESWVNRNQTGWNMIVGRGIIVPVMDKQNPSKDKIIKEGITPESLARMSENSKAGNGQNLFLKCYAVNDATVIKGVEKFMNTSNLKDKGIETASEEEVIIAIMKDPRIMGFCRLNHIATADGQDLPENIELVPIDKNGNGKIDYMEEIYDNLQAFERGVWIGKYPKALSDRIYAFSAEKPEIGPELAFLNWLLIDGQQFLSGFGYNDLVLNERQSQLAKIEPVPLTPPATTNPLSTIRLILIILLVSGIILLVWRVLAGLTRTRKVTALNAQTVPIYVFDENSTVIPGGLFFDKTHTWTFRKKDGTVKVGIDDFLQHVTGKITRAKLRKTGDKIRKGEHLLTLIQKGKQLNIYSPVSGTIKEKNRSLSEEPSLINTSPYKEGWVYIIEPKNWPVEIQFLSMAEKYKTELKKEFQRLKDFLVSALKVYEPEYAMILQDGGALKDNILGEFGPEVWDDFQTKFIDTAMH